MFYDLEEPIIFAKDIAKILADDGIWVMEQSYLPTMLEMTSYDTICHEHLEFYCLAQIEWIVRAAGMKVINVSLNDANGGSFRVTVANKNSSYYEEEAVKAIREHENNCQMNKLLPYARFNENMANSKKEVLDLFSRLRKAGKRVYGYGASTKGNVLLQYCGFTSKDIIAIAEVNEEKFGHVTPGSRIPIISEEEAKKEHPDFFIVLPWHFKKNILTKEKEYILNSDCKFIFPLPKLTIIGKSNLIEELE